MIQWSTGEINFEARDSHDWWSFPVEASFTHATDGTRIVVGGFWDGGNRWRIRFTLPSPGQWKWHTRSRDRGLDGRSGKLDVVPPTSQQMSHNPNYRGYIGISANGRYFEHADGTPCFLLADTLWAGNTARCGLGDDQDGPFFTYLDDRKSKGFTAILMQFMRGFGDTTTEPAGQRNEGGYPFEERDLNRLNPGYFQALDSRMDAIWRSGLVAATPVTWWGKMGNCFFPFDWAKRISEYLMVRYGAYNLLWSLSGEYQFVLRDCGWSAEQISELGDAVQAHNVYRHPVSIHPTGSLDWPEAHRVQSSRAFHNASWLDHNWLQTGQSIDRIYNIASRCMENYDLTPAKPVFCSETYYERPPNVDAEGGYHSRLQVWSAFLNGATGYGYGAFGVWQFYDPDDPQGETGKNVRAVVPWQQGLVFEGANHLQHIKSLLTCYEWWRLEPHREWLNTNGAANRLPSSDDLAPPHCAAIRGELLIVYIPRGNEDDVIGISHLDGHYYTAEWFSPRDGSQITVGNSPRNISEWTLPERPRPANEDWVLLLHRVRSAISER